MSSYARTTGAGWPADDWEIQPGGDPLLLWVDTAHNGPPCLERRHMYTCARPAGHTGRHVATGVFQHPDHTQTETDEQGRNKILEVWA